MSHTNDLPLASVKCTKLLSNNLHSFSPAGLASPRQPMPKYHEMSSIIIALIPSSRASIPPSMLLSEPDCSSSPLLQSCSHARSSQNSTPHLARESVTLVPLPKKSTYKTNSMPPHQPHHHHIPFHRQNTYTVLLSGRARHQFGVVSTAWT
ncbi:hypothetical protein EJ03DRAFT_87763 [Teratosphaeria nubilosa]|uniref:Uncharacterized protein n=1 Tax=Teratosphaeria nubilosa TaxID=161662 RepID=A0A6G1LAS6_9PEZI|nr:hypothetical protein EJ03DRAFT_87763 [Teratosphaeria nubilosa]